jgi:hypothetical protein
MKEKKMNLNQLPRTLTFHGRTLVSAGNGKTPQSAFYFDPSQQRLQEFFIGTVKTSGQLYAMVSVEGTQGLSHVRVDLGAVVGGLKISVGDKLLISEIREQGASVNAALALMLAPATKLVPKSMPAVAPGRCTGTIIFTQGTWGKISSDVDGSEIFAHLVQWRPTVPMQVGQRCSFVKARTEKGVAAFDIRIAA